MSLRSSRCCVEFYFQTRSSHLCRRFYCSCDTYWWIYLVQALKGCEKAWATIVVSLGGAQMMPSFTTLGKSRAMKTLPGIWIYKVISCFLDIYLYIFVSLHPFSSSLIMSDLPAVFFPVFFHHNAKRPAQVKYSVLKTCTKVTAKSTENLAFIQDNHPSVLIPSWKFII